MTQLDLFVAAQKPKPSLFLTNFSSLRTVSYHGLGSIYTIMARPHEFERGSGRVWSLTPELINFDGFRYGRIGIDVYRRQFITRVTELGLECLAPGRLLADCPEASEIVGRLPTSMVPVQDGSTLCCACSRDAAARGECHRVWAAELLREAGWRVVLDGEVQSS